MSQSIPVGLQSLLTKHYFLAQITRGHKPCMTNMRLVSASSWLGGFYRSWRRESRKTVMNDIKEIINETIDAVSIHKDNKDFLKLIINALSDTRVGLESMTTTYREDPDMIGKIRVQLTNIDLQLNKYRHLIKGYTPTDKETIEAVIESTDTEDPEGLRNILLGRESQRLDRSSNTERRRRRRKKSGDESIVM